MAQQAVYVGIDVAGDWLDVYVSGEGEERRVGNDAAGVREVRERLGELGARMVELEALTALQSQATGGLESAVVALPVVAVNPRQVRDFARATGRLAKTASGGDADSGRQPAAAGYAGGAWPGQGAHSVPAATARPAGPGTGRAHPVQPGVACA